MAKIAAPDPSARGRTRARAIVVGFLFAISCGDGASSCGGGGCAGCGDGTYQYPDDAQVLGNAARVRVTQALLDFIRPRLPDLIVEALGQAGGAGGFSFTIDADRVLHVAIPDQDLFDFGFLSANLRRGEVLLWLEDIEQKLKVDFEAPNGLRISMENLRVGVNIDLDGSIAGADSTCPVSGRLGTNPQHAAEISMAVLIEPGVGPDPDRKLDFDVTIDDIELGGLDLGARADCTRPRCTDCTICNILDRNCNPSEACTLGGAPGCCGDPGGTCGECRTLCDDIADNLLDVVAGLLDVIKPLLNRLMKPVIQNFVRSALEDLNDQPAKLETQLSLAELTGFAMFKAANPIGVLVGPEPGKFPVVTRQTQTPTVSPVGMEITAAAGSEAELADCIPSLPPFNGTIGPVPTPSGVDSQFRPYHVWATLSSTLINQLLDTMHRSGALCLKLTTADVRQLTSGAFTLNASILGLLASDLSKLATDRAPVILQLKPREPPRVSLGSGQKIGVDPEGKDIIDPLLAIRVRDMGLAFHVLMHDRYVRVFEVAMDLNVGLNVVVKPDNVLELAVTELRIDDFVEEFNEVLPNADFADVLPALIDVALSAFITSELKFDVDLTEQLSSALGGIPLGMRVNDIFRDGVNEDFLTLTMTFTDPMGTSLPIVAETRVERATPAPRIRGAELQVAGEGLEYQVRVDGGLWSAFRAPKDGVLAVDSPRLRVSGRHVVEVRARYAGAYATLDPSPATVEVEVDARPPSVSVRREADGLLVRVADDVSAPDEIAVELRDARGSLILRRPAARTVDEPGRGEVFFPDALLADAAVSVIAEDRANNRSSALSVELVAPAASEPLGCTASGGSGGALALVLLGLVALSRRRLA